MISQHTAEILEFPKILSLIAEKCLTAYGPPEVKRFGPMFDLSAIETRLDETNQLKDIYNFGRSFPLSQLDDCRDIIGKSQVAGAFLDPEEIIKVLGLVEVSIALHEYDPENRANFPAVVPYLKSIRSFPELKKEINRIVDVDGQVKDSASTQLRRIRGSLFDSKRRIVSQLETILSTAQKQVGWQDDVITQRNGRYVIPVLSGQYRADQGILHDRSQSGATLYVEPRETVELNNRIHLLMQEERAEVVRILTALTGEIGQRAEALMENTRLIGQLDARYAAAKFASETKGNRPKIHDLPEFDIQEARHPLLVRKFGGIDKVVPLSASLNGSRQALLITGPNTGGKTVALKTLGLTTLMVQSGLLVPASESSCYGIFRQVFADIGDEQSIELSLSTFSSHIRNISEAVAKVSDDSLALLDEIGAGTDPKEGAALAEAIILFMVDKGTKLVASTHYSQLKTLALDHPEIENASLEFDRTTLAPTYRLQMGLPGSSYAVEIAGRLGIPRSICKHAAQLVGSGERSLSELIASLEKELAQIREDRNTLAERLARAEELERFYRSQTEKFNREVEQRKREALTETDNLLETTRAELERLVADIRKSQAGSSEVKTAHKFIRETKDTAERVRHRTGKPAETKIRLDEFKANDRVRIVTLNKEGDITEIIGEDRARVQVGGVSTVVKIRDLEKLDAKPGTKTFRQIAKTPPTGDISREIHLRGMTVDEATEALDRFLDQAVLAGLPQIYVVHGKGTGTLRRALTEYLKNHPEVESLTLGNWNEGGAGVTVVKLKS
ncbi:MAG: endonuclease MutS2 [Candidatus Zixiibacteriota bacterium]